MDLENRSGAQHCRKDAVDTETTTNVSFYPALLLIPQIVKSTIDILEKEGKVKDTDFFVPSDQWVYMLFSLNNEYCSRSQYYRGVLPYVRSIISRVERDDSHPCAH